MSVRVMLSEDKRLDSQWDEVKLLNSHAKNVAILTMVIKGLAVLVLTWTTVVLLGGFVSVLQKKDFWCLTFITLVQTSGIFHGFRDEKLSCASLWFVSVFKAVPMPVSASAARFMLTVLQVVSMLFLYLALLAVCLFGLLISAGVSLWRLIQRDYGRNTDGTGNLKPALDVLYSLALLQGVIFCYRAIYAPSVIVKMKSLAKKNGFVNRAGLVGDYLDETNIGCEDNPSFARGRNLITYAVDLMGSNNPHDYSCGLKVLEALMWQQDTRLSDATPEQLEPTEQMIQMVLRKKQEPQNYTLEKLQTAFTEHQLQQLIEIQRHTLLEYLILSPSSSHILPRLLQTLDSTSMYDRETRGQAARIVAHLADHIRLEQFPRGIMYVSSLINTFEEYSMFQPCERRGAHFICRQQNVSSNTNGTFGLPSMPGNDSNLQKPYRELVLHGLHILEKLAADEDNCRVISNTRGLLSKIMAPVTSDLVHQINHDAWSDIIYASLQVMSQLAACKGEAGDDLRREMSKSKDTISTLERILKCQKCDHRLTRLLAMEILAQLYNMVSGRRETIIKLLVDILKDTDLTGDNSGLLILGAGEILGGLLSSDCGSTATLILEAKDCVVDHLTEDIIDDDLPGQFKISATEILEQLCIHYTQDDDNLNKLKEAMPEVMQKVLTKLLPGESTQIGRVADSPGFSSPDDDIELGLLSRPLEGQYEADPQHGNSVSNTHSSEQKIQRQYEKEKLQPALFSFCVTTYNTFIAADQDLAAQFDAIHACTLPRKLCDMVRSNTDSTAGWLKTLKAICKMIISIIQHREGYLKQDLKSLMEALTNASENMVLIDGSMVFANDDDDGGMLTKPLVFQKERINKPVETLASLVIQVKELVDDYKAQELDVTVPSASTSTGSAASSSSPRGFARFSSLPGSATPTSSQTRFSSTGSSSTTSSMLRTITTGSMFEPQEQ